MADTPAVRHRLHSCEDARRLARVRLPRIVFDFIDGAVGAEVAAGLNQSALSALRMRTHVLEDVGDGDLACEILGQPMGVPFGIAPMGLCNLAWPGADRMLAAEAVRRRMPLCLSTAASSTLESMRQQAGEQAWFQLYASGSAEDSLALTDRAAKADYGVLILTVDVPRMAQRPRDLRNGLQTPLRIGPRQFLDLARHPRWALATLAAGVPAPANFGTANGASRYDRQAGRAVANWAFLHQLRSRWKGRLVVKGVLSPEDALRIRDAGADAIYVSNHGGRQLDSAPAAIHALAGIRAALGPGYPLLFDSGVRSGEDIVKALACGASFVLLGRPWLYAAAADGARGLVRLGDLLAEEVRTTLAQAGLRGVRDIGAQVLASPLENG